MAESDFRFETLQESDTVREYLRAIADGLSSGGLLLSTDGREIRLEPKGLLRFRCDARTGKRRTRVTIRLAWREEESTEGLKNRALRVEPGGGAE